MSLAFFDLLQYYQVPRRIIQSLHVHYTKDLPDPYYLDTVPAIVQQMEQQEWLFLHGPPGGGKTTYAAFALACHLRQRDRVPGMDIALSRLDPNNEYYDSTYQPAGARDKTPWFLFVQVNELLSTMKRDFDRHTHVGAELYERCLKADCLVLDDLTSVPTAWELDQLDVLINHRYGDMSRTIITSNYSLDVLKEQLSERIKRRIDEASQKIAMLDKMV